MSSITPKECQAWRSDRYYNINRLMVEMIAQGVHVPQPNAKVVSEKESLIFKTTKKAEIIALQKELEKEFKKYAGKKADTKTIFNRVIDRTAGQETSLSV
jgi:hypothetical protein